MKKMILVALVFVQSVSALATTDLNCIGVNEPSFKIELEIASDGSDLKQMFIFDTDVVSFELTSDNGAVLEVSKKDDGSAIYSARKVFPRMGPVRSLPGFNSRIIKSVEATINPQVPGFDVGVASIKINGKQTYKLIKCAAGADDSQ